MVQKRLLLRLARIVVFVVLVSLLSGTVLAAPPDPGGGQGQGRRAIPVNAVEVAPGLFYLGKAAHNGQVVEGYAFVRYREAPAKPGAPAKTKPPAASTCYAFLAKGAKWKSVEPYTVAAGSPSFAAGILATAIGKWESAANTNILGNGSTGGVDENALGTLNYQNEIWFATLSDPGIIAVTYVWGIFGGPVQSRVLVEWDQVYNLHFAWGDTGAANEMDFDNIATHELGHSVGLADLYTSACATQTMYGYSWEGDIAKRTLEQGDILGVSTLYR